MKKNAVLPTHVQFFMPIIEALRKLGGSASLSELKDVLVGMLEISEDELEEKLKTGVSRIDNQIVWSKVYLVREGLIDVSDSNIWSLTEDGLKRNLNDDDVLKIFKKIHSGFVTKKGKPEQTTEPVEKEVEKGIVEHQGHKVELLEVLKSLPPEGFERLCQRLLRVSGFTKVVVKVRIPMKSATYSDGSRPGIPMKSATP